MIFTIAPLVQEAKSRRRWLMTLGIFTGVLVAVLAIFGAAMSWAGSAIAARVTTPWAREVVASVALTILGGLALVIALGELGLARPLLPRVTAVPAAAAAGAFPSLTRRALVIALAFGATMAIFSPLSAYALMLGWVAAQQSPWLGALTLAAYGLGLVVPLAIAGTLTAGRGQAPGAVSAAVVQERVRLVGAVSLAAAGGFMLSMWTVRATWALFFPVA
jgi:cytochrome c biogenesis protein CcdA